MKTFKYLTFAVLAICLASCGGKETSDTDSDFEIEVSPADTDVSGDLEGCFTVVDRNYKAIGDNLGKDITIELERTEEAFPFDLGDRELAHWGTSMNKDNVQVKFIIEILDESGNVLEKYENGGDEAVALAKLREGKKGSIAFSIHLTDFEKLKDAAKFRVSTEFQEKEGWESSGSSSSSDDDDEVTGDDDDDDSYSSSSSRSSGSTDWDEVLSEYEKYVDKYIALLKKAKNGDASAISEYASMAEQAQALSEKLQNASGEMSSAQLARYNRITQKMARAAQQM